MDTEEIPVGGGGGGGGAGGAAPRPTLSPTVEETGLGSFKATWGKDPQARAIFEPAEGGAVNVTDLARGFQPKGSGGVMLADALKAANLGRPDTIRGLNIWNEPTVEALAKGTPASETAIGRTLSTTATELGAKVVNWRTGTSGGRPFIEIKLDYGGQ